jgi:hypothetical protein
MVKCGVFFAVRAEYYLQQLRALCVIDLFSTRKHHLMIYGKISKTTVKQEVLERTNLPTFLTFFTMLYYE